MTHVICKFTIRAWDDERRNKLYAMYTTRTLACQNKQRHESWPGLLKNFGVVGPDAVDTTLKLSRCNLYYGCESRKYATYFWIKIVGATTNRN